MRLKIKLVWVLLIAQRHLVIIHMKTGLPFFTWIERKRMSDLMFAPKDQSSLSNIKCKI